jgi:hypothetical protein
MLDSGNPAHRREVRQQLQHWLAAAPLAGVRGPAALDKLPPDERAGWAKLWAEAKVLRQKASQTK